MAFAFAAFLRLTHSLANFDVVLIRARRAREGIFPIPRLRVGLVLERFAFFNFHVC